MAWPSILSSIVALPIGVDALHYPIWSETVNPDSAQAQGKLGYWRHDSSTGWAGATECRIGLNRVSLSSFGVGAMQDDLLEPRGSRREPVVIEPQADNYLPNLRELWAFRELFYTLVWRNFKVRYRQAALGTFWVLLQPFAMMVVFTLVFGIWVRVAVKGVPYSIHILSGLILVFFINRAISESLGVIRSNANLTRKVYFPKLLLPLAVVIASIVDLAAMAVMLLVLMAFHGIAPAPQALLALGYIALLVVWGVTVAVALAALGIRYLDLHLLMPLFILFITYMSPIIYPITLVSEDLLVVYALNPMVGIVNGFRWCVFGTEPFYPWMGLVSLAEILILGILGLVYFVRTERSFNDLL